MSDDRPRYQRAGDAPPVIPEERAADDWRRAAERDPTLTTGDALGGGVDEVPNTTEATSGAQLPPEMQDQPIPEPEPEERDG